MEEQMHIPQEAVSPDAEAYAFAPRPRWPHRSTQTASVFLLISRGGL